MADYLSELELDPERFARRITFLVDRAKAHEDRKNDLDTACAATLRRDAGALALLLGRSEQARSLFLTAGRQWSELGIYAGYFLMSLGQQSLGQSWFEGEKNLDEIESSLSFDQPVEDTETKIDRRQLRQMSRNSPRQLLSLYQAAGGGRRRSQRALRLARGAAKRLSPSMGSPIGTTGIPLGSYLRLYNALGSSDVSQSDRNSLFALAIRRDELVSAAQADRYHWRLLLKPAELIDFDLLALGITAIEAGGAARAMLFSTVGERGPAARLPFEIARDLDTISGKHSE